MHIRDLEFFSVAISSSETSGETESVRSLIVRLVSHSGVEGWGETVHTTMPLESLLPLRHRLLPVFLGRNVFDLEELVRLELFRGFAPIRFALETACWDMMGRLCGQPICRFLGGEFRSHIPITLQLTGQTPDEMIAASQELANRGFHRQSLTLTGRWNDDLQLIRQVLDSTQHQIELHVDAAGRYDWDDGDHLLSELEKFGVALLIDPLRDATPQQLATLQKRTSVPFGVRAGLDSARDVLRLPPFDNLSCLILEPQRLGSLLELRKCADIAEAAAMQCAVSVCGSTGPMTASMMQLAAALPALSLGLECTHADLNACILKSSFDVSDGLMHLPLTPGLGTDIDRQKLEGFLLA